MFRLNEDTSCSCRFFLGILLDDIATDVGHISRWFISFFSFWDDDLFDSCLLMTWWENGCDMILYILNTNCIECAEQSTNIIRLY